MRLLEAAGRALSYVAAGLGCFLLLAMTVLPGVLHYKPFVVLSGSMSPSIPTGSVVFAVPSDAAKLRVGDVIMFDPPGQNISVTHRIVDVKGDPHSPTFTTKGDANQSPDPWTVKYNGPAGKVVLSLPAVGYLYHALGSREGHLIFLIVPVVVLSLMYLAEIWRPKTKLARDEREAPKGMAPALESPVSPLQVQAAQAAAAAPNASDSSSTLPLRQ